jgi:hypothetical protein
MLDTSAGWKRERTVPDWTCSRNRSAEKRSTSATFSATSRTHSPSGMVRLTDGGSAAGPRSAVITSSSEAFVGTW